MRKWQRQVVGDIEFELKLLPRLAAAIEELHIGALILGHVERRLDTEIQRRDFDADCYALLLAKHTVAELAEQAGREAASLTEDYRIVSGGINGRAVPVEVV